MPHRTRRTVALVVLLVVVGLAAVLVVQRVRESDGTTPAPPSPSSTMSPTTPSLTAGPTYEPTDAYGSPEPGLARGDAEAGGGGRTLGPAGLPLGYSRNPTGAANAATNYLTWMNSLRIADKSVADAMAAAAASDPATRTALTDSFDALRSGMGDLTADEEQVSRGAYAVASYSPQRATVYVWAPEVTTDRSGQTEHLWSIDAVPLVWVSDDWKLDQALIARTAGAAVDPTDPAGNPTAAEKHSILTRTPADPGDITDSADQTWLEYANAAR
jgi:hypothetical protein